jgi:hypothetical protein
MPETDTELRTAIAAFLRGWAGWAEAKGHKSFGWKLDDPAFEQKAIDVMIGQFAEIFRAFHAKHGRWPTFDGIGPLGSPFVVGERSDIR